MALTLANVEALAPDQSSLKAASKLIKPAQWPELAFQADGALIWGACQGSGANPYRVVVDTADQGYKCTCPSRKFPCKHALALMWLYAEGPDAFAAGEVPDWVGDWLGRRRKSGGGADAQAPAATGKNLAAAARADVEERADPAAEAKRRASAEKRAAATRASVRGACEELEQWIADQLRTGLGAFATEIGERCRRIASRLVDAKAAGLASRVDELPARILGAPGEQRADAVVAELGGLLLLVRAWRAQPDDPALHRAVIAAESREQVLGDADAPRRTGPWEVVAETVLTRRDGLVSQATWLLALDAEQPSFAQLLDFFPASAGRRGAAFAVGERFHGELAFYPAAAPLRAVVAERADVEVPALPWPAPLAADPLEAWRSALLLEPWRQEQPLLLPPGRIAEDRGGALWWRAVAGEHALPLDGTPGDVARGTELEAAVGLWNGLRLTLTSGHSVWGRLDLAG